MQTVWMVVFIGALLVLVPQGWAQDVGSFECGEVQVAAQDAVAAGGLYRNHGQLVRTAANVVSPSLEAGDITEECSSCIINQFARRIPIEEQEPCGDVSDCCFANGTAGTYDNYFHYDFLERVV